MSRRAFYLINLGNNDDTCEKKKIIAYTRCQWDKNYLQYKSTQDKTRDSVAYINSVKNARNIRLVSPCRNAFSIVVF